MSRHPLIPPQTCPLCNQRMKNVFARMSGPVDGTHRRRAGQNRLHGKPCRVIVIPDPVGDNHRILPVPDNIRLADMLETERNTWDRTWVPKLAMVFG